MRNPIVILHGWSDNSSSFKALANFLQESFGNAVQPLYLADWLSMHDDVSYADLADAMQKAWLALGLPTAPQSVDIVVHSTGALVTRQWFTGYYSASTNPVKRFVQLAPANFGSPLAHKGRSFYGRAVKGWNQPGFQTGAAILTGLELAADYTRKLAQQDLFANEAWYGAGKMLATILIGDTGYSGISAIANEAGSDGTVRICGANLNCSYLRLALDAQQQILPSSLAWQQSKGAIAFSILAKENHSSIIFKGRKAPHNALTQVFIRQALMVTDQDFQTDRSQNFAWQQQLDALNPPENGQAVQRSQVLCRLTDQHGVGVNDYFLEMYRTAGADSRFEETLYRHFLRHVHTYSQDPANRAFYFDLAVLERLKQDPKFQQLYLSFSAQPHFKPPRQPVGYYQVAASATGGLCIPANELARLFTPQQTLLLDVQLQRVVAESVFKISQT